MMRLRICFAMLFVCISSCEGLTRVAKTYVGKLSVGLDFGTSGVRRCIINQKDLSIVEECHIDWCEIPQNLPSSCSRAVLSQGMGADESSWTYALLSLLYKIPASLKPRVDKICVSGTSASCLIYDHKRGIVSRKPRMYNYNILAENPAPAAASESECLISELGTAGSEECEVNRMRDQGWRHRNVQAQGRAHEAAVAAMCQINAVAPPGSSAAAPSGTLAKLLQWHLYSPIEGGVGGEVLMHQADFCAYTLLGGFELDKQTGCSKGIADNKVMPVLSEWHNSLKLGYDVQGLGYGNWVANLLRSNGIHVCANHEMVEPQVLEQAGSETHAHPPSDSDRDDDDDGTHEGGVLPIVIEPGQSMGRISRTLSQSLGLNEEVTIIAGTTDSIAAFLAAGASELGEAVTSLGSTMVVKLLSNTFVEDNTRGVYCHRLGDAWLVGGASSVGCRLFRDEGFTSAELKTLSSRIDPYVTLSDGPETLAAQALGAQYYPLPPSVKGERFPENDPTRRSKLEPKPPLITLLSDSDTDSDSDSGSDTSASVHTSYDNPVKEDKDGNVYSYCRTTYLHALLESMTSIEKKGYDSLMELGATPLERVYTSGGGAKNPQWTKMRERALGVPTRKADNVEASYGVALLSLGYPIRPIGEHDTPRVKQEPRPNFGNASMVQLQAHQKAKMEKKKGKKKERI